jgi:hypothetical protein
MLDVEIDGVKTRVPQCTCGKCIVRRLRKNEDPSIPYNKDLQSIYTSDYPAKRPIKDKGFLNKAKLTGFDNQYKETLPGGLVSTMKGDYVPYDVKLDNPKKTQYDIYTGPFTGPTTNEVNYLNWGSTGSEPIKSTTFPDIKIPLRGKSNYNENYIKYPTGSYKPRDPIKSTDSQKPHGKLADDTTYNTDYIPHDSRNEKFKPLQNTNFITADNPPDNFDTTYRINYIDYDDKMCRLRKYLNARGMRYLVV